MRERTAPARPGEMLLEGAAGGVPESPVEETGPGLAAAAPELNLPRQVWAGPPARTTVLCRVGHPISVVLAQRMWTAGAQARAVDESSFARGDPVALFGSDSELFELARVDR